MTNGQKLFSACMATNLKPGSHYLQGTATVAEGQVAANNWKMFYFYCNELQQLLVAADSQQV